MLKKNDSAHGQRESVKVSIWKQNGSCLYDQVNDCKSTNGQLKDMSTNLITAWYKPHFIVNVEG